MIDKKIPSEVPEKGIAAEAEIRGATGTKERAGAIGITAGEGNFAVRVEGMKRRSGDYRVPDWSSSKLDGSYSESTQGTVGMSWITPRGYIGLAFTHLESKYGLPGHNHEYEGCHPHGTHLHCGGHDHDHGDGDEAGHDHDHDHGGGVPYVKLRSNRTDLRAEYLDPFAGIEKIRLRGGLTDYQHQEIEGGEVGTTFKNRGYDLRLEAQHKPIAGWRGVVGMQTSHSDFRADGEEAFLPRSKTRANGIFLLEEYKLADWRFELGARQDWQTVSPQGGAPRSSLSGTSLSAAAIWNFAPEYSAALSLSRSQRLPTAQELYAKGVHLATNTYEIGNAGLGRETSHNIDLTLRKHSGATTFSASVFHNRVKNYIYANTLDRYEDFRLIEYTQRDAEFTGVEGELRHQFTPVFSAAVFGDYVRGKLTGGDGNLPRIPAARAGLRGNFAAAVVGRRRVRARVLAEGHRRLREQHTRLQPGQRRRGLSRQLRLDRLRGLPARHQPAEPAGLQPCLVHLLGGAVAGPQRAAGRAHDVLVAAGRRGGGPVLCSRGAATGRRHAAQEPAMLKFAANLSMMYTEHAFLDRYAAAAADGFDGVECMSPYEAPAASCASAWTRRGCARC